MFFARQPSFEIVNNIDLLSHNSYNNAINDRVKSKCEMTTQIDEYKNKSV